MKITSDWHIHSRNSCDGADLPVAELVRAAAQKGIVDFGLSDHLHTPYNWPDIVASRREYLATGPAPAFHFGIEVSVVSAWEMEKVARGDYEEPPVYGFRTGGPPEGALAIALTPPDIERYDIEYVVGGTHWPLYVNQQRDAVIRDYHRQNMFLAVHPLVNVIAHPWWWMDHWWYRPWKDRDGTYRKEPWFDDFRVIPRSMHDEFRAAVREHRKVVEINLGAMLLTNRYPDEFKNRYLEYLAGMKDAGVRLCIGSDCHTNYLDIDFARAEKMLDGVGIRITDLWTINPPDHEK